jgi:hypothetical protein
MNDSELELLSKDIDESLMQWVIKYKTSPLNISGVMLARLLWLSKMTDSQEDFIKLLEAPKEVFEKEKENRQVH